MAAEQMDDVFVDLTEQERRVALAVSVGQSNKATARELAISVKTVEFHLVNVYRKLGVASRGELSHLVHVATSAPRPGVETAATHDAALRADTPPTGGDDPVVATDELLRAATVKTQAGDLRGATRTFVEAADMARRSGDVRRFAEAALGAAGDGTRVALDAVAEVTMLVREALERLPRGPTRTRARLLARLSVLQSQSSPPSINEPLAASALDIANASRRTRRPRDRPRRDGHRGPRPVAPRRAAGMDRSAARPRRCPPE